MKLDFIILKLYMNRTRCVGHLVPQDDESNNSSSNGQPIADLDVVDQRKDVIRKSKITDRKESLKR